MSLNSIYKKASIVQIPSGYKSSTGKLYSVIPNTTEGDFDATVSDKATRVNEHGIIEYVSANQPRLSYDPTNPTDPFLLTEPTRTNYIRQSQDFEGWQSASVGADVQANTNETLAPDNTNTACKLLRNEDFAGETYMRHFPNTNGTVVVSFFAKKGNSRYVYCRISRADRTDNGAFFSFDLEDGTLSGNSNYGTGYTASDFKVVEYKNGWYRCSASVVTATNGFPLHYEIGHSNVGGVSYALALPNQYVYIWGCQMEKGGGSTLALYPSSYIKTPHPVNAVTRTADKVVGYNKQDLINKNEGTVFLDMEVPLDTTATNYFDFTITENTGLSNRITISFKNAQVFCEVWSAGIKVGDCSTSIAKNQRFRLAFSYKTNEFRLYINGIQEAFDSVGTVNLLGTPNAIKFTERRDFRNKFEAKVYQMMCFKEALTQSELATLTEI